MTQSLERQMLLPAGGIQPLAEIASKKSQKVEAVKDIVYGSIAGIIGKAIEYPFDTIKVRLQSQPDAGPPRYTGPIDCFRQSLRNEGLAGLYRGISAPFVGAAVETSSLFFSYRIAQDGMRATIYKSAEEALPLGALVTCGAAGGAVTSLLLTPIELIKCQMQVPLSATSSRRPSPVSLVASVYRHHGILGFWHGQLGTLIRETGGSAAWFGSYEATSAIFRHYPSSAIMSEDRTALNPLPVWQQMASGATAGVAYNLIFYPADTIKSRMQTAEVGPILPGKQKAFWTVGRSVWQQQGIQGLYRGCGITVARAAPSSAFIFTIYEGLRGWLG